MSSLRGWVNDSWEAYLERMDRREQRRAMRLTSWRTRRHRRAAVVVAIAGNVAMIVGAAVFSPSLIWTFFWLWFGGFVVWIAAWMVLRVLVGKLVTAFSPLLDERERELRHRVTYLGFQVFGILIVFAIGYALLVDGSPEAGSQAGLMLAALSMLGSLSPTLILGWTLPDDDPDDLTEILPDDDRGESRA